MDYPKFPKIPRLDTEFWITEKIDGTNGLICIEEFPRGHWVGKVIPSTTLALRYGSGPESEYLISAGSRKQWITPEQDNFGFARWVWDNAEELVTTLGPGHHYGEWYGSGINRGYGLTKGEKRFMLFHVFRWHENPPETDLVEVATVLEKVLGDQLDDAVKYWHAHLLANGSSHVPGFDRPEGVVIQSRVNREIFFKAPLDRVPKSARGYVPGKLDLQAAQARVPVDIHSETYAIAGS